MIFNTVPCKRLRRGSLLSRSFFVNLTRPSENHRCAPNPGQVAFRIESPLARYVRQQRINQGTQGADSETPRDGTWPMSAAKKEWIVRVPKSVDPRYIRQP